LPLTTVFTPWLVAPAPPPKLPKAAMVRKFTGAKQACVPVVKLQMNALAKGLAAKSVTPVVTVATKLVLGAKPVGLVGTKVATLLGASYVTVPGTKTLALVSVKLLAVMEAGAMASLKVAVTLLVKQTPVAPSNGLTKVTVGAVMSPVLLVVNVHTKSVAKVLLAKSFAKVVILAVNKVLFAKVLGEVGVNVAVRLLGVKPTVPVTGLLVAMLVRVKLLVSMLLAVMSSLKVALIPVLFATPVAASAGKFTITVGRVVSASAAVVNTLVNVLASGLPAKSVSAVLSVTVYSVLFANGVGEVGVNTAELLAGTYSTVPVTAVLSVVSRSVMLLAVTVLGSMLSLKLTFTLVFTLTLPALFSGVMAITVGAVVSAATAVLNDQTYGTSKAKPVLSLASVVIVAVHVVLLAKAAVG
jgi:hypothetical protein